MCCKRFFDAVMNDNELPSASEMSSGSAENGEPDRIRHVVEDAGGEENQIEDADGKQKYVLGHTNPAGVRLQIPVCLCQPRQPPCQVAIAARPIPKPNPNLKLHQGYYLWHPCKTSNVGKS